MYQVTKKFFLLLLFSLFIISCGDDEEPNAAPSISAQTFNASEGIVVGDAIGTVSATDVDSDALTFSISANDNNLFTITAGDATTQGGQLGLNAGQSLDFETATSHTITVVVSDGQLEATAIITINVLDVDENTAPSIADQSLSAAEDIDAATAIGTVTATDAEGNSITYSITANDNGLFEITAGGELSLASGQTLDFETSTSHSITVEATDGGLSNTATITITVTDVDESPSANYTVSTFAGSTQGFSDGQGTAALFDNPSGVAVDADGNVYVADSGNNRIRKIDSNGNVTTIAGTGVEGNTDGAGTQATFTFPDRLDFDNGNIYVSDVETIRVIDNSLNVTTLTGRISTRDDPTTFRDGTLSEARFSNNKGITIDNGGNIFVVDNGNHRIRKIDPSGNVTTFAGSGQGNAEGNGTNAKFRNPRDVAVDSNGNIFIVDNSNDRIRKIDPSGNVTTFAGSSQGFADGQGTAARFHLPSGITIDSNDNLYITDTNNIAIRRIDPDGNVITIAGGNTIGVGTIDGAGNVANFDLTQGIAVDANGVIYVADPRNHRIRKIVMND